MRIPLLLSCLFLLPIFTISVSAQCLGDQKSLLLRLKNSLTFNTTISTKLTNWTQTLDCCQWGGVTCDQNNHVSGLDLSDESISDGINQSSVLFSLRYLETLNLADIALNSTPIPSNIGNLTNLRYLDLSWSGFSGQIPSNIGNLTNLRYLDLSYSGFSGQIPSNIGNLTNLRHLDLSYSEFYGQIPTGLSLLTKLVFLDLSYQFTAFFDHDRLPVDRLRLQMENPNLSTLIRNLNGVEELYLYGVNISANGYEWGRAISSSLPNLRVLSLSDCALSGPIDVSLQKLQYLSEIHLDHNNLSSPIPNFFANFRNLTVLSLRGANLSGPIPSFVANLSHLVKLDFGYNNFSGPIPSFQGSKNLTYLDLSNNSLTGEVFPTYFEGLLDLAHIDLSYNSFNGSVPSSLFSLPSLQYIDLSNNKFGGHVTGYPNESLSPLRTLDLSENELNGTIPSFFFDFLGLYYLSLSFNRFSGTVELQSFQRLQNLTSLHLSYNNLTVDASVDISILSFFPQLTVLSLASCNLQKFPALMNQSTLQDLDLSNNKISGVIPNWIWNVGNGGLSYLNVSCNLLVGFQSEYIMPTDLYSLDLHSNQLGGEIPLPPKYVDYVDYSNNNFTTSIPVEIGNDIHSALFFSLANNALTGTIPPSICNWTSLQVLDLSNNTLSGTIPQCLIENCTESLGVLNLGNNNLIGSIFVRFPRGCVLQTLDLNGNHLEGNVPESLSNCKTLEVLNIGHNNMYGNFPCFLENLSNLHVLVLRSNSFQGRVSCPGMNNSTWPRLQIFDIALNNFNGNLPPKLFLQWHAMMIHGSMDHLHYGFEGFYYQDKVIVTLKGLEMKLEKIITLFTVVDLSGNNFKGEIPDTIGALSSLYLLNLSRNALSGQIPSNLGNLKQLGSLDLSFNKLKGTIPVTLTSLTFLSFLNLSHNQLVGRIPLGTQLQSFPCTSYEGNEGLCGPPLNDPTNDTPSVPSSMSRGAPLTDEDEINWVYIAAALGYTMGFEVIVGPLFYSKRWRQCYYKHFDRAILKILYHREQRARRTRTGDNKNQLQIRQHH